MRCLLVIDPLASLNPVTETSLLLAEELGRRGHAVEAATLPDLYLSEGGAGVRARPLVAAAQRQPPFALGPPVERTFDAFDLVLMRKDPPVDAEYVAATFILERAAALVPVVNDPVSLRVVNEKLLPLRLLGLAPPTLVSSDARRLREFAAAQGRIVLKPLEDCSGRGIRVVEDGATRQAIARYVEARRGYVMAQRFLEGVMAGDKRILLLAGEPIGAVNRVPRSPRELANIHQGARVEATTVTRRDRAIIAALRPLLLEHRLWLAGIDVIDGYLTEVNVTSPSAARQINAVSGGRVEVPIVDFLERVAARGRRWRAAAGARPAALSGAASAAPAARRSAASDRSRRTTAPAARPRRPPWR